MVDRRKIFWMDVEQTLRGTPEPTGDAESQPPGALDDLTTFVGAPGGHLGADDEPRLVPYDEVAARVEALISAFDSFPDVATQAAVAELVQLIDALHRAPLRRLADLLETYGWDSVGGFSIPPMERAKGDPLIRRLFELYDLVPVELDPVEEVDAALDEVRPYIQSHGGDVQAVSTENGVITVELSGHCRGCTASQATLRGVVEEALRANVANFQRLEVRLPSPEEAVAAHPPPAQPFISIEQLRATAPVRTGQAGQAGGAPQSQTG